nr:alkane hydroxylase mah1 [Quercus suber]
MDPSSLILPPSSLIPVLDHISSSGIEVDLQDIFQQFTFDTVCLVALGIDPNCLSIEFPDVSHAKAFDQLEECLIYRHIVPESCWKLQRWLQIGSKKKLSNGWKILDQFIYKCISSRQEEQSQSRAPKTEVEKFNLLTATGEIVEEIGGTIKSDKFLRDTAINLTAAGKDGISAGLICFFWIVATHPYVEAKILEEIKEHLFDNGKSKDLNIDGLRKLVYLHGAICETLRLFPPIPFEHKFGVQYDILPSGHSIRPNTTILCSLYSMGRMESIWGEDLLGLQAREMDFREWRNSACTIFQVHSI